MSRITFFISQISFYTAMITLLSGCGGMPAEMPEDFSVSFHIDGGMLPQGFNCSIKQDSSVVEKWFQGNKNRYVIATPPEAIRELYQQIREAQGTSIKTYEEEGVYDRGGESVGLTLNGEHYNISDGGMSFIKKGWQENFSKMVKAIDQYIENMLEPFRTEVSVKVEGELPEGLSYFNVGVNEIDLISWSDNSENRVENGQIFAEEILTGDFEISATTRHKATGKYQSDRATAKIGNGGLQFIVSFDSISPQINLPE